jgi:hypothetical protein
MMMMMVHNDGDDDDDDDVHLARVLYFRRPNSKGATWL